MCSRGLLVRHGPDATICGDKYDGDTGVEHRKVPECVLNQSNSAASFAKETLEKDERSVRRAVRRGNKCDRARAPLPDPGENHCQCRDEQAEGEAYRDA